MVKKIYDLLFKLFFIGDFGVGKMCFLFRFFDDVFNIIFIFIIGKLMMLGVISLFIFFFGWL